MPFLARPQQSNINGTLNVMSAKGVALNLESLPKHVHVVMVVGSFLPYGGHPLVIFKLKLPVPNVMGLVRSLSQKINVLSAMALGIFMSDMN